MYHKMIYEVKPEQLEAMQEKVKMLTAEGRRLDGSKPVKSWKELRDDNHELQKKLEEQTDIAEDYKRRYAFAKQHLERMTKEFGNADKARREAIEQCARYKDLAESLMAVVAQFVPDFHEEKPQPVVPLTAEEQLQVIKDKRKAANRRYYLKHREEMLERSRKWYEAHPGYRTERNKSKREAENEQ